MLVESTIRTAFMIFTQLGYIGFSVRSPRNALAQKLFSSFRAVLTLVEATYIQKSIPLQSWQEYTASPN